MTAPAVAAAVADIGVDPPTGGDAARPAATVHYAQTIDGRIATRTGHSQWVSSPDSLLLQHQLRARHDAVLVGIGTILADDPRPTVRLVPGRQPLRVALDLG